jgi:hypothetical protein
MYLSFKYGNSERVDGDRFFCDLNERRLDELLAEIPSLQLAGTWHSADKKQSEQNTWINVILKHTRQRN